MLHIRHEFPDTFENMVKYGRPWGQGNWIWIRMIIANLLLDTAAMKCAHIRAELASEGWY